MTFDPSDPAHPDHPFQRARKGVRDNATKLAELISRTDNQGRVHPPAAPPAPRAEVPQGVQGLAATVTKVAANLGASVPALLDSVAFTDQLARLDDGDLQGVTNAVRVAIEANPQLVATKPAPRPFAGQGASSNGMVHSPPQTPRESIRQQLKNQGVSL